MTEPKYQLTNHCCKHCLGRILFDGTLYRCSNCAVESIEGHEGICACGATMKSGRSARLRCTTNKKRDATFPGEIVVEQQ